MCYTVSGACAGFHQERDDSMKLNVMSFNIQHCLNYRTREIDYDLFAQVIAQSGADVIALNEVYNTGVDPLFLPQAEILGQKLGFFHYFAEAIRFDGVNPYGNALLSRYPISQAQTILVPDPPVRGYDGYYETRCLLKARIEAPTPVTVCAIHFGLNPDEQALAQKTVLENIEPERCVLMGDFNITPDDALLTPIRERMQDAGEVCTGSTLSFPSDAPERKIDYIFASRDWRITSAEIVPVVASDHRPHVAQLELD